VLKNLIVRVDYFYLYIVAIERLPGGINIMTDRQLIAETEQKLQEIMDKLRKDTQAGRTTVRIDHPDLGVSVDSPAAESLREGVHSIKSQTDLDVWNCAAARWLIKNKRTFVMNDCMNPWDPEVAPEREVIEIYGIQSEMVTLVTKGGEVIGLVSVHYTKGARNWTEDEIRMIESASDSVRSALEDFEAAS
jgi:GAF domain-containing protein